MHNAQAKTWTNKQKFHLFSIKPDSKALSISAFYINNILKYITFYLYRNVSSAGKI